jgi:hypothetical protein
MRRGNRGLDGLVLASLRGIRMNAVAGRRTLSRLRIFLQCVGIFVVVVGEEGARCGAVVFRKAYVAFLAGLLPRLEPGEQMSAVQW